MNRIIYLAGGCFWGLEHLLRSRHGVIDTEVGYMGGRNENPTYEYHPGHAEAVRITYDTTLTSYDELVRYFFKIHDPTTKNRQGNDMGSSYRSTIFFQDQEEKEKAEKIIININSMNVYRNPIATTLEPFAGFYPAEEYHQDYLIKNPGGYTCHYEREWSI